MRISLTLQCAGRSFPAGESTKWLLSAAHAFQIPVVYIINRHVLTKFSKTLSSGVYLARVIVRRCSYVKSSNSARNRRAHSEDGLVSTLDTHLLSKACACALQSMKPKPPLSLGCVSFFHVTNGVFLLPVSLSNPHKKSLNSVNLLDYGCWCRCVHHVIGGDAL